MLRRRPRFVLQALFVLGAVAQACSSDPSAPAVTTPAGGSVSSPEADAAAEDAQAVDGAVTVEVDAGGDAAVEAGDGGGTALACNDSRPQLSAADSARFTALAYLAQAGTLPNLVTDGWDPTAGLGAVSTFTATYTVGTGGAHTTVQSAIDAAVTAGGTDRVYIAVTPGTYREVVCVPAGAPPITLYGTGADATATTIVYDNYNGKTVDGVSAVNACVQPSGTTYGTNGSATFAAFAAGFQAKNLTIANDTSLAVLSATSSPQGVALMTEADKVVLDSVRLVGHQDTFYAESPASGSVVRVYVKSSYVAGDTDFVFGGATLVVDGGELAFVNDRKTKGGVLSPDTNSRNPYGFLVVGAAFTAPSNAATGTGLGRAWDRSCTNVATYVSSCEASGSYPNGQAVVRGSTLGAHIAANPWLAAATTSRPFCNTTWTCVTGASPGTCVANRLFEYENTGPGSKP